MRREADLLAHARAAAGEFESFPRWKELELLNAQRIEFIAGELMRAFPGLPASVARAYAARVSPGLR